MADNLPHLIFAYGQQHFDGWACRDCGWQTSNTRLEGPEARALHDKEMGIKREPTKPLTAEQRLDGLRKIWLEKNVGKNSFYINGFSDRLAQLADLYDEDIAEKTRALLTESPDA